MVTGACNFGPERYFWALVRFAKLTRHFFGLRSPRASTARSPKDHKKNNANRNPQVSLDPHLPLRWPTKLGRRPDGAKEISSVQWPHVIEFRISLVTSHEAKNDTSTGQRVNQSSRGRGTVQNAHGIPDCASHPRF